MRHFLLTVTVILSGTIAVPAIAQVIPEPSAGHQLYIRDKGGKVIERLQPNGDKYDVYDVRRSLLPMGYAKVLGRRMVVYDLQNNIIATMRAELLPPDSDLALITIVRDPQGHPMGLLERH